MSVGVVMNTAATASSAMISSIEATCAPYDSASEAAASGSASATATSRAPGVSAIAAAWTLPIRPAPSSPMVSGVGMRSPCRGGPVVRFGQSNEST